MCRFISYRRVSTERQGQSGLGLEAQAAAIDAYVETVPGAEILGSFVEVESRKMNVRPELTKAIALARKSKAVLVVGKLDRLLGDFGLLVALRDAKVRFVAADDPTASELTVDIRCAIAKEEVRKIGIRTREALARAKANGVVLGKPQNLTDAGRKAGNEKNRQQAIARDASSLAALRALHGQGKGIREIARELDRNPMWVSRALKRFGLKP
jgi:DNA invertase Pin-like site-specific DNA recombinase